jgi:hypothetical protein
VRFSNTAAEQIRRYSGEEHEKHRDEERKYLLYSVAGEGGVAGARLYD